MIPRRFWNHKFFHRGYNSYSHIMDPECFLAVNPWALFEIDAWTQAASAVVNLWIHSATDTFMSLSYVESPSANLWTQSENDTVSLIWNEFLNLVESLTLNPVTMAVPCPVTPWIQDESLVVDPWTWSENNIVSLGSQDVTAVVSPLTMAIASVVTLWYVAKFT